MNTLFAAAVGFEAFCRAQAWRHCIIGGMAVQRWGDPRQTRDVDVTVLSGLGGEARFIDAVLGAYRGRIPEARAFALAHRVILAVTDDGTPLDISLAGLPYEERLIDRSSRFDISADISMTTCSAEDLVVLKAFADRAQDWLDVEGVIVRQGAVLNRLLVLDELHALLVLKEDPEPEDRLRALFRKHPGA
jgi:hypothetical protein